MMSSRQLTDRHLGYRVRPWTCSHIPCMRFQHPSTAMQRSLPECALPDPQPGHPVLYFRHLPTSSVSARLLPRSDSHLLYSLPRQSLECVQSVKVFKRTTMRPSILSGTDKITCTDSPLICPNELTALQSSHSK